MVYQAVAEYWASAKEPEYNVSVDLMLPGKSKPLSYNFNRNNHYATRTSKVRTHFLTQRLINILPAALSADLHVCFNPTDE